MGFCVANRQVSARFSAHLRGGRMNTIADGVVERAASTASFEFEAAKILGYEGSKRHGST